MTEKKMQKWYRLDISKVFGVLNSSPDGLKGEDVSVRQARFGPNRLQQTHEISPWLIFLEQFKDVLIIILIFATVVSLLIGETLDAVVIFSIVVLCALLGFFQEYRSEKAVEALKRIASPNARVIREGKERIIPAHELVPGDIVCLQTGDIVPADARVIEAVNLRVNEAVLTGESVPVLKYNEAVLQEEVPVADRGNMLFASTDVTKGRGRGIITETGMNTEFGKIAAMLQEVKSEKTPLEVQMDVVGRWLGFGCLGVCLLASLIGILRGYPLLQMFVWGVSLAVAAVPEALPAVVTSALAIGVQCMAKQHAIVKRLAAVETLGCTTVICSDKTGTLTKNEMTVQSVWAGGDSFEVSGVGYAPFGDFNRNGKALDPRQVPLLARLLEIGILCNDATLQEEAGQWKIFGDPTEGALLVLGVKGGIDVTGLRAKMPRAGEIPFEEARKLMSTINEMDKARDSDDNLDYRDRSGSGGKGEAEALPEGIEKVKGTFEGRRFVAVKGAPETILERCSFFETRDAVLQITQAERDQVLSANENMAKRALRVLALAWRRIPSDEKTFESGSIEKDLVFCGLVGMIDPPRDEVPLAVRDCIAAGIRPVIVTGDHVLTAQAIARSVGILEAEDKEGCGESEGIVLNGEELEGMNDAELDEIITRIRVFARVSPEHKLRIVNAYQRQGEVVAMTGDGVNDAPALKKADIGVAMGIKGTDVSREAADMVLADDNFATIIKAVKEGRAAFENIKKYLIFLLSCNIGEILILAGAFFLGLPLPLIAIQILWVNLTTDGLPALALGIDPPAPDIMGTPPRGRNSSIFTYDVVAMILIISFFIFGVLFFIFKRYLGIANLEKAQTMVFLGMILLELFNAFNCRSVRHSIVRMPPWDNIWLMGAVFASFLMSLAVINIPFMNVLFHTQPLSVCDWGLGMLLASSVIVVVEFVKLFKRNAHET